MIRASTCIVGTIQALVIASALVGCGHTPARVQTVTALIPVKEACVPKDFPPPPAGYADDDLPAGPAHLVDRFKLRSSANEARKGRLALVEPVISKCR